MISKKEQGLNKKTLALINYPGEVDTHFELYLALSLLMLVLAALAQFGLVRGF